MHNKLDNINDTEIGTKVGLKIINYLENISQKLGNFQLSYFLNQIVYIKHLKKVFRKHSKKKN